MIEDTAIVFIVFDGYEDLWDDAIKMVEIFWPTHPPIYVFTNTITHQWPGVVCVPVGDDAEWSKKVQMAIEKVEEKFFILMLEDFYIGSLVDNHKVASLIRYMNDKNIDYCRLCNNNRIVPQHLLKYEKDQPYDIIYRDQRYGISLQASIWNKDFLKEIVGSDNYNAWVFEINQAKKTLNEEHIPFYNCISDPRNILNIKHGALQGKMLPDTVRYFDKIGLPLTTSRAIMDKKDYLKYILKHLGKDLTPSFAKTWVKHLAKRLGYSFLDEKWS